MKAHLFSGVVNAILIATVGCTTNFIKATGIDTLGFDPNAAISIKPISDRASA
jgi:hypothetical protein